MAREVTSRSGGLSWGRIATAIDERRGFLAAAVAPLAAALVALVLIVPTVMPDVSNWDTAEFQTVLPVMGTAHPTGFPSYVILGWIASIVLMPFGTPAYRVDLLQAILAAFTVGCTVSVVRQLGAARPIAFATGLVMATTLLFWRLSTHADPHMFHLALVSLLLVLLLGWEARRRSEDEQVQARSDRWLVATTLVYGVAFANHSLAMLLAPGIAVFVLLVDPAILFRWRRTRFGIPWGIAATCVAVLAVAIVGLFLELPVRAMTHAPIVYGQPDTWKGFWYVVLAEQFTSSLVQPFSDMAAKSFQVLDILRGQLDWALYLLPLGYLAALWRKPVPAAISGLAILSACVILAPDQFGDALRRNDVVPFCLPLGLAMALAIRPRFGALTGLWFAITCWFAMSYVNADIGRYYLGPLLIAFTWVGLAASEVVRAAAELLTYPNWALLAARLPDRLAGVGSVLETPGAVRSTLTAHALSEAEPRESPRRVVRRPVLSRWESLRRRHQSEAVLGMLVPIVAVLLLAPQLSPAVDRYRSPGQPGGANESNRVSDRAWLEQVMAGLPANSVVISWWSASTTLWYGQKVEHMRPDIFIADDRTRIDMGLTDDVFKGIDYFRTTNRPLFVIRTSGDLPAVQARYQLRPWFNSTVYQVLGPAENAQ